MRTEPDGANDRRLLAVLGAIFPADGAQPAFDAMRVAGTARRHPVLFEALGYLGVRQRLTGFNAGGLTKASVQRVEVWLGRHAGRELGGRRLMTDAKARSWFYVEIVEGGDKFDPALAWAALDTQEQRRVGELALLILLATSGRNGTPRTAGSPRWDHAARSAAAALDDLLPFLDDPFIDGPDLEAVGIRSCRGCGCTDDSACEGGCSWTEPDLCSRCPDGAP